MLNKAKYAFYKSDYFKEFKDKTHSSVIPGIYTEQVKRVPAGSAAFSKLPVGLTAMFAMEGARCTSLAQDCTQTDGYLRQSDPCVHQSWATQCWTQPAETKQF